MSGLGVGNRLGRWNIANILKTDFVKRKARYDVSLRVVVHIELCSEIHYGIG